MLHVFLTPVQLRWTVGVFFAAVVGTLLPFAIHRHFSKTADRLLAVSSAFTGGVCSSVAFFLCQEGTQQLQLFWGARIAAKLGPSTSILSYLAIYCTFCSAEARLTCLVFYYEYFFLDFLPRSNKLFRKIFGKPSRCSTCDGNYGLRQSTAFSKCL